MSEQIDDAALESAAMSDVLTEVRSRLFDANRHLLESMHAVENLMRHVQEQRAEIARLKQMFRDATSFEREAAAALEQTRELERLRAVLRQTHERYCGEAWTSRGLHAPECLACEVEP